MGGVIVGGWEPGGMRPGVGEMFHVTAQANRASIERHGLDWRRMGAARGIAGSPTPELPAVFLCETFGDVPFFVDMADGPTDVWAVQVDGCRVADGPDGWVVLFEPVPPERVRRVEGRG
jgi:hypothetical protein